MLDQLQSGFASFQRNDVRYVVIGGIAAVLYGVPRATWNRRVTMTYKGQNFEVVSLGDLISSKRAAGRDVDLEDVRILLSDDANSKREDSSAQ